MAERAPSSAETQTLLFTDVEGSTQLRSEHGDRVADEILGLHERVVRGAIQGYGGREVAFLGDGFMAAFASPDAALRAAIAVQRALEEHNRREPGRRVRVRTGIHLGEVIERDHQLFGQAVHAAARLSAQATGGQILISTDVRDALVAEDVPLVDRGLFWLKGFPDRWRLYEAAWSGAGAPSGAIPRARAPLVERDAERADLRQVVEAALAGHGSLVLVAGEAGVGKTRITQEVDAEAETHGMHVLVGHSVLEESAPYLPFVEILEDAFFEPRSPEAFRTALGDAAPEVARLVPALRRVIPDLGPPLDLPPEQARRYLWVSVEEWLDRASQDRPLLLVLEDLHWADESTVALLEYLTPRLPEMPVLVLGTYRDMEVEPSHPLARAISQLSRRRLVTQIALRRLSEEGVAAMIRGLATQDPPPGLVRAIQSETDGNPFFVEEVFLHLSESGQLFDEQGRFLSRVQVDEVDVPQSVRVVLNERLERLSAPTREILVAAAVVGRAFTTDVVERVAGVEPDELIEAFDEAERARLIDPADAAASRFAFGHELIRQTLLAETPTMRRQRLHLRAVEALEDKHADDVDAHAAELAYHLSRAGAGAAPARQAHYERLAGENALQASAFEDAVAHLERAASLAPDDDRELRAGILESLAMALRSAERWDDAIRAMDGALGLYEELGRKEALGRLAWAMVYHLAWAARFEEAAMVGARALGALGDVANPDRARILSAVGWAFGLGGDHETSTEMMAQARALTEQLSDPRALADVAHLESIHHMSFAEFPMGVEIGLQAAAEYEREGALWDLCSVLSFVVYQLGTMLEKERATELAARAEPIARRLGHLGATFLILADRVRTEGVDPGDAARLAEVSLEMIDVCERGSLPWTYVGHLHLGIAAWMRGDREGCERHLRKAAELETPSAFYGQSSAILAQHLAREARHDEAMAIIEGLRPAQAVSGRVNTLGQWNVLFGITEALALMGRNEEAAANLPLIEEALALGVEWVSFDGHYIHTRAGIAAAAAGDHENAERYFAEARELAEALGNRPEVEALDGLRATLAKGDGGRRGIPSVPSG